MSQSNIVVTQLAQLGLAERIAQEAQSHPEVTRQAAQQASPEALKQQKDSVGQTEDSEGSRGVKAKTGGRGGQGNPGGARRRKGEPPPEEGENDDGVATAPWSGNILNLKI